MSYISQSPIQVDNETNSPGQALSDLPSNLTIFIDEHPIHTTRDINQAIIKDPSSTKATCCIFQALEETLEEEDKVCLSPRSALSLLLDPTITLQDAKDIAITLSNTTESRRADFAHQMDLYAMAVDRLQAEADTKRAVPDEPPYGFVPNDNHISYFIITDPQGHNHITPYIRKCPGDPTRVIRTLGGPNAKEFSCPIYATPRHSDGKGLSTLPPWFIKLLHCQSPHADTLIDNAYQQEDWGLAGDLHAYRNAVGNLRELYRQQDTLRLQIQAEYEQWEYVRHRLEGAQAPSRLLHFRSLVDGSNFADDDGDDSPPASFDRSGAPSTTKVSLSTSKRRVMLSLAPAPAKRTAGGLGKSWEPAPEGDFCFCQCICKINSSIYDHVLKIWSHMSNYHQV